MNRQPLTPPVTPSLTPPQSYTPQSHTPLSPLYIPSEEFNYIEEVFIKFNKEHSRFSQIYHFYRHNKHVFTNQYWSKKDHGTFKDRISVRLEYEDEPGMDYGGIRGKIFKEILNELKSRDKYPFFDCNMMGDYICISNSGVLFQEYFYDQIIDMSYFIGILIGLCYSNSINMGWLINPFLIYIFLRGVINIEDETLKKLIKYCLSMNLKYDFEFYDKSDKKIFDDFLNDNDESYICLMDNNLTLADIIKYKYYINNDTTAIINSMTSGFRSIINMNIDDNDIITYIDGFLKIVYGEYDINIDDLIDNIVINGNFKNMTNEDSKILIKKKLKLFFKEDIDKQIRNNKLKNFFGFFTGNPSINSGITLAINILESSNNIEAHTCGNNICIPAGNTSENKSINPDTIIDIFIDSLRTFDLSERTSMAGGKSKKSYLKHKYNKYIKKLKKYL